MDILVNNQSGILKGWLGQFALWVESTFGLYNDVENALAMAPKTDEELLREMLVLYDLLRKAEKKPKYYRLFEIRCKVAIVSSISRIRPAQLGPEEVKELDVPDILELIREKLGVGISIVDLSDNLIYYSDGDNSGLVFDGNFIKAGNDDMYRLFLILNFLISLI